MRIDLIATLSWENDYQKWYGKKFMNGLRKGIVGVMIKSFLCLYVFVCLVLNFVLYLLDGYMVKERSILLVNSRILSKIYEQRWYNHRYVGRRSYTTTSVRDDDVFLSGFDLGHLHHIINIGQAVLKEKEIEVINNTIMEVSFVEEKLVKKNLNCSFVENLNEKNSMIEIESKMKFFCEKGLVKEKNKSLFLSNLDEGFVCNTVSTNKKEINFVAINNLTTSSRNDSILVIEPKKMSEWPISKGLFVYPSKTMVFLLEGHEDYRKFICLLVWKYWYDKYNAGSLLQTKSQDVLIKKSEDHVNSIMGALGYDVKKYQYFGISSGIKMLDYLIEKMDELKLR